MFHNGQYGMNAIWRLPLLGSVAVRDFICETMNRVPHKTVEPQLPQAAIEGQAVEVAAANRGIAPGN